MAPEQPDAAPGVALTLQALDSPALLTLLRTLQSIEAEDAPRLARHLTPQGDGYAVETGVRNRDAKLAAWMDWRKGPDGQPRGRFPVDPVRFALYAVTADYILDTVVNWMRVQRSLDLDPAVQAAWAIAEPTEYLLERAGFEFRIFSPRHAEYHANHGVALFNVGDLEGAEKACRIAIQKRPELVEAHAGLGVVLYRAGKYEDAANALLIASGIEGASADVFFNRAATLYRTGDLMGAARALRGVLSRTPDDADAEAWLAKADPEGKTAPPPPPPKPAPRSRSRRRR